MKEFEKTRNAHSEADVISAIALFLVAALLALAAVLVLAYA